jgi:hypothetical protein
MKHGYTDLASLANAEGPEAVFTDISKTDASCIMFMGGGGGRWSMATQILQRLRDIKDRSCDAARCMYPDGCTCTPGSRNAVSAWEGDGVWLQA